MSFIALMFALILEQVRPLSEKGWVQTGLRAWIAWVCRWLDVGQDQRAWLIWSLAVGLPSFTAWLIYGLLMWSLGWPLAVLWSMVVLYVTLGFRQFSHHFTDIRVALEAGDEVLARQLFADWHQVDAMDLPRSEMFRHVIEHAVIAAHRHVFGVLVWFSLGAALGLGPAGAVLYRMSQYAGAIKPLRTASPSDVLQGVSVALFAVTQRAWHVIDWIPARVTALFFAVVGNFEEAIDCWRQFAASNPHDNEGTLIAATAGALNVQLGGEQLAGKTDVLVEDLQPSASESWPGREPELGHLRSLVGLVWRTVVLWLVLLCLLSLARLLG
ncbi:MAG: CobD/CbiB family protein [Betaproteobacteria bacterium]|nr:CobD/CbiB family protein [Betaproteobacteria bacterium]NBY06199.1 CobD/CbiB family protein [Betaproteobacteria bacterium]